MNVLQQRFSRPAAAVLLAGAILLTRVGTVAVSAQTPPQTPVQTPPQAPVPVPPVPRVEFDEAIQLAIAKNQSVAQAATSVSRAEALLQQSRSALYPVLGASFSNVTLNTSFGFEGIVTQPQNQSSFGVTAAYTFLQFSRWAEVAQSRDQVDVAKFSAADVRRAIAVSTAEAYLAVIAAHRQVDVDERALVNARDHLDYAQKRLDAGAGSLVNQLRAASEVSSDEARLEATQLVVRRTQEALGVLLVAGGPVDSGQEPVFDVPTGPADQDTSKRTDMQLELANQHAAERVSSDSKKDWFPVGSVSFSPQFVEPAGVFQPAASWRLTVSVAQPILDGAFRRAVARERATAVEFAKLAVAAVDVEARSEIRVAQDSIQSLERALVSARLAAQQATDVLRITTTAFQVGATTNLEVIDAQRSARDADSTATLAADVVRRARLDLLVAMGRFPK